VKDNIFIHVSLSAAICIRYFFFFRLFYTRSNVRTFI